jgi:predicted dienelactone hydrolase
MRPIAILAAALLCAAATAARASVGFTEFKISNGDDRPLVVGVWYPSDAPAKPEPFSTFTQMVALGGPVSGERLPLIVMSHGTGGWYGEHADTSMALAEAGFVVAAVSHTGDTYDDASRNTRMADRAAQIHRLIDYMLAEWPAHGRIDPRRVGMFGFSSGGFTALVSIGGTPDLSVLPAHWSAHPDYFDSQLAKRAGAPTVVANPPASTWIHDPRIRAAVIAAPALGFTFGREGLKDIAVPVQLWRAEDDHILPNPDYAEAVRIALPKAPDYHVVPNADHYDFLAPCDELLKQRAPDICVSRPGFDRTAFHQSFNREVARFFQETLR